MLIEFVKHWQTYPIGSRTTQLSDGQCDVLIRRGIARIPVPKADRQPPEPVAGPKKPTKHRD